MARNLILGLLSTAALVGVGPTCAVSHHRHAHASRHHARQDAEYGYGQPYGSPELPAPTCRYPNGTPYDPDIIGGANHVGDGGPAANLGGFDPCGN